MTTIPQPSDWSSNYSLTYDAWNRLVKVEDGQTTVATYAYDARSFRIEKAANSETRAFFYNTKWQCLEERAKSSTTADMQFVWGRRYIDDLVLCDRDTARLYSLTDRNWNVVAIVNANAAVQNRLRYDAYGTASTFNGSYSSASLPTGWAYTSTTRRLDSETGCMYYRNRYYHPKLGRFQKRDPIGYRDGINLLSRYKVIGTVDPSGLEWCDDKCSPVGDERNTGVLAFQLRPRNKVVDPDAVEGMAESAKLLMKILEEVADKTPGGGVAGGGYSDVIEEIRESVDDLVDGLESTGMKTQGVVVFVKLGAECCRKKRCCVLWHQNRWVKEHEWKRCSLSGSGDGASGLHARDLSKLAEHIVNCIANALNDTIC